MAGSLDFTGTVDATGETFRGKVIGCDHDRCQDEVRLTTRAGVTCHGPFFHVAGVHSKAELLCSDGRWGELNVRTYGRNTVSYGNLGGKRAVFEFTDLRWQRAW